MLQYIINKPINLSALADVTAPSPTLCYEEVMASCRVTDHVL